MSATTNTSVDWVQLRHDEQEQLQRRSSELFEGLLNSLKLNVQSFQKLYNEAVTAGLSTGPYRIALRERSVSLERNQCRISIKTTIGLQQTTSEMEIVRGLNGDLQLRAGDDLLSIDEASQTILMPVLFPQMSTARTQVAAGGR